MARTVSLDQTLLAMGFALDGNVLSKKVDNGQVMVTLLEGGKRVRVNAKHDTEGFLMAQSFTQRDAWQTVEAALNKALALLVK